MAYKAVGRADAVPCLKTSLYHPLDLGREDRGSSSRGLLGRLLLLHNQSKKRDIPMVLKRGK